MLDIPSVIGMGPLSSFPPSSPTVPAPGQMIHWDRSLSENPPGVRVTQMLLFRCVSVASVPFVLQSKEAGHLVQ